MSSVVLIVVGVLLGWFLEWLYVYVTKTTPEKNQIQLLENRLKESEQSSAEAAAKMTDELKSLQSKITLLESERESAATEADSLREELAVVQQSMAAEQKGIEHEAAETKAEMAGSLDADTELEKEFEQAIEAGLAEKVESVGVEGVEVGDAVSANNHSQAEEAGIAGAVEDILPEQPIDDLTCLTGVGPKTASLLNEAGLLSFKQLASMDTESLHAFLQTNHIPHSKAKIASWTEQAAAALKET